MILSNGYARTVFCSDAFSWLMAWKKITSFRLSGVQTGRLLMWVTNYLRWNETTYILIWFVIFWASVFQGSSNLVALSFSDLFPCSMDDLVPVGVGPHLLFSYVDQWYFMLTLPLFLFCFPLPSHNYWNFPALCKPYVNLSHQIGKL